MGEPQLSISKDSEYKSEFRILGENLNNTLLFLKNPPSWLSLVRETEHKFYLSGTPREIGTYTVNILGNKYIDQNRSFQDEINFQINVQPKIVFDSNSTNIGNWRTNWFGYFNSFQDSGCIIKISHGYFSGMEINQIAYGFGMKNGGGFGQVLIIGMDCKEKVSCIMLQGRNGCFSGLIKLP